MTDKDNISSSLPIFDKVLNPFFQLLLQMLLLIGEQVVDSEEVFLQTVDQWDGELVIHCLLLRHHNQPSRGNQY